MVRETLKSRKEQERQEALEHLRNILQPGDRVFGIIKHISRSGMQRLIDFYTFGPRVEHGQPAGVDRIYLSGWIATALDYQRDKSGALKVGGCGMDMIFSVVYQLGRALFPEGFGEPCKECGRRPESPDNAQFFRLSVCSARKDQPGGISRRRHTFHGRNGDRSGWDADGGYALKAESL